MAIPIDFSIRSISLVTWCSPKPRPLLSSLKRISIGHLLYQNQPAENQLMSMTKDSWHTLEKYSDKVRQIGKAEVLYYGIHDG